MKFESFSSQLSFRPGVARNVQSKQEIIKESAKSNYDFRKNDNDLPAGLKSAFPTSKGPNTYEMLNRDVWQLSQRKTTEPRDFNNTSLIIVDPVTLDGGESLLIPKKR